GAPRQIGIVDLGAYEADASKWREVPSIIVTTLDDVVNPYDGWISLREAVEVYFSWTTPFDAPDAEYGYYNGTYYRKFDQNVDATGYTVTFDLADYFAKKGVAAGAVKATDLVYRFSETYAADPITVKDSMTIDATSVYVGEKDVPVLDENGDVKKVVKTDENGKPVYKVVAVDTLQVDKYGDPIVTNPIVRNVDGKPVVVGSGDETLWHEANWDDVWATDEVGDYIFVKAEAGKTYVVLNDSEGNQLQKYVLEYEYETETTTEPVYLSGVTVDALVEDATTSRSQVFVIEGTATNAPNLTLKEMSVTNGETAGIELKEGANLVMIGGSVTNTQNGAGIQGALNTSITLDGVVVSGNENANGYGGGVSARNGLVTIKNSTFENNSALAAGGVFAANLYVANSSFTGNEATANDGNGLGTIVIVSRGRLTNTLVADNTAYESEAGVVALRNAIVDVYNGTIVNNESSVANKTGVDLQATRGAKVSIYNSIVGLREGTAYDSENVKAHVVSTNATLNAHNTLSSYVGWKNGMTTNIAYDGSTIFLGNDGKSETPYYALARNAQTLDQGDREYVQTTNGYGPYDLTGKTARVQGESVDLGAY
ncbi:MAG: hypothetical protein IK077_13095, partial [Thermoguttaceae bacterium]|nr:hypothetical protein [Thermoguttaceae bacterium]